MASGQLQFPYVCGNEEPCTRDEFHNWSVRQEWRWDDTVPLPTAALRLQCWLFFGLLSIYAQEEVLHERVLTDDVNGRKVIDFFGPESRLQKVLRQPSSIYLSDKDANRVPESHRKVQDTLRYATLALEYQIIPYLRSIVDNGITDIWTSESYAIIFGVDLMVDLLFEKVQEFQAEAATFSRYRHRRVSLPAEVKAIQNSGMRNGRCPSLARRLRPLSCVWYQILLLPHVGSPQNHSACENLHCQFNSTGDTEYQTKHTVSCGNCEPLSTDPNIIVDTITLQAIPLVECFLDPLGKLEIRIVKGDLTFKYTAISHVWTGGFGNPNANSLPSCQIEYLWNIVRALPDMQSRNIQYPGSLMDDGIEANLLRLMDYVHTAFRSWRSVYIWIDTLCIPAGEQYKESRQQAIKSMAQIYAGAETVLVLDTHMQQLRGYSCVTQDLMNHLIASPWMSRSWPLQEGAVAPSLCVRLKDETVILNRSQHRDLLALSLHYTNSLSRTTLSRNPTYTEVWNALASRGTTKREDLDGIFATLLNLNTSDILEIEPVNRMVAIIATQKSVPFSLMCIPRERVNDSLQKHSWVPRFPDTSLTVVSLDDSQDVLLVVDKGFLFKKQSNSGTFGILVRQISHLGIELTIRESHSGEGYIIHDYPDHSNYGSRATDSISLLIFTLTHSSKRFWLRGCRFRVLDRTDTSLTMNFENPFLWQPFLDSNTRSLPLNGERFEKLDDPSYKILIPEDFKGRNERTWFRPTVIPFTNIVGSELDVWLYATFPVIITNYALFSYPIVSSMDLVSLPRNAIYWALYCLVRIWYTFVQRAFWRIWLANSVQRQWAATFYNTKEARKLLGAQSPTLSYMLWTYFPIYMGAGVLLVLSWTYEAHRVTFAWIICAVSLEPLVSMGCIEMILMKQRLEARGYKDVLPFRLDGAILSAVPGAAPCLYIMLRELFTNQKPDEVELSVFGYSLVYVVLAVILSVIWITGFPGVYYSFYKSRRTDAAVNRATRDS